MVWRGELMRVGKKNGNPVLAGSVGLLICLWWLCLPAAGEEQARPIWLVVTKPAFRKAIEPLAEYRRAEGFEVIISTDGPAEAMNSLKRRPGFVLLVGDDQRGQEGQGWYLPARRIRKYRWDETQTDDFASDAILGDLDGDLVPDIPVGRIPARTEAEIEDVVKKIISFEQREASPDDLRMPVWAGAANYGAAVDSMATGLMMKILSAKSPRWVEPWLISADAQSPFCGWPFEHAQIHCQKLKQGGVLAVLVGHGGIQHFFSMKFAMWAIWFDAAQARGVLSQGGPTQPLVMICCLTGDFSAEQESLGESLLFMSGGPVATIGATTESHPLTNYFSGLCLVEALGGEHERLGELWVSVQKQALVSRNPVMEAVLANVEGKLEEEIDIPKLRREHLLAYAILGDPATRLRLPGKLHGKIKRTKDGWQWQVQKPEGVSRLYVGLRPEGQVIPEGSGLISAEQSRADFQAANKTFEFQALAELDGEEDWSGVVSKPGVLRLVATGPGKIYVAVVGLRWSGKDQ